MGKKLLLCEIIGFTCVQTISSLMVVQYLHCMIAICQYSCTNVLECTLKLFLFSESKSFFCKRKIKTIANATFLIIAPQETFVLHNLVLYITNQRKGGTCVVHIKFLEGFVYKGSQKHFRNSDLCPF